MVNVSNITFTSKNGTIIKCPYFKHAAPSDTLAIVFPGHGYNCDMPLLYFCSQAALQLGCDVINLKYYYQCAKLKFEFTDDNYLKIANDCHGILKSEAININAYKHIIFASKSLGTVIAGKTAVLFGKLTINHFFLTPLRKTIQHIERESCTVIVGTEDGFFSKDDIEKVNGFSLPIVHVIDGADHSLEIMGDCIKSLEILTDITKIWMGFACSIKERCP